MKKTKTKIKNKLDPKNETDNTFVFSAKNSPETAEQNNLYYTLIGGEDFIDEENNPRLSEDNESAVMAKKVIKNKTKYLIKTDNTGKFYNPLSPISSIRPIKILQTISVPDSRFKEVNKTVFNMYLNFLRSKNIAWINNAEREVF